MSRIRRRRRTDANQREIVDKLRSWGFSVEITSDVGGGFPDIVVGARGHNFLFEIKGDDTPWTKDENEFFDKWRGQVSGIYSAEHALNLMEIYLDDDIQMESSS